MLRIVVPALESSKNFFDSYWPKNMIEVMGKPMIQYVVESFEGIQDKEFIFC